MRIIIKSEQDEDQGYTYSKVQLQESFLLRSVVFIIYAASLISLSRACSRKQMFENHCLLTSHFSGDSERLCCFYRPSKSFGFP